MSLRDQLMDIREKRGQLTPECVVQEAAPEDHPLHDRFEWDNAIAGPAWRRHQAHELIQSVRIVYGPVGSTRADSSVRAFHAVRGTTGGYVYEPAEEIVENQVVAAILLRDMEREWQLMRRRYERFREFYEMIHRDLGEPPAA